MHAQSEKRLYKTNSNNVDQQRLMGCVKLGGDIDKELLTDSDRVWVGTQWSMRINYSLSATSTQRLGRVHDTWLNTTTSLAYTGLVASITVLCR